MGQPHVRSSPPFLPCVGKFKLISLSVYGSSLAGLLSSHSHLRFVSVLVGSSQLSSAHRTLSRFH